jgi:hypothetical protein
MVEKVPVASTDFTWRMADNLYFQAANWEHTIAGMTFGHVAMYYGKMATGEQMIIESIGRGVTVRSLTSYVGETVEVKRTTLTDDQCAGVIAAAGAIDNDPDAFYNYWGIARFAVPKLLLLRFGGLMPKDWDAYLKLLAYTYKDTRWKICSQLVADSFSNAGFQLVSPAIGIPLPDDCAASPLLTDMGPVIIQV